MDLLHLSLVTENIANQHGVKRVRIRSYCVPHFPAFSRIRTEYGEIRSIQSECRKTRENAEQNNCEYELFLRSAID